MRSDDFITRCISSLLLLVCCAACERARIKDSAVDQYPRAAQELDFLDALEKQMVVTNDDALHGLIVFADGADLSSTYEGRVAIARQKEWVSSNWNPPADESAQIGWMSVAACRIVGIRGGLSMRVMGPIPRYATKELVFMDVLPLRTENQSLSGREFVDFVNRLARVQKSGKALALAEEPTRGSSGEGVIPAGAPNQLLDQSSVEFGLPNSAFSNPAAPAPEPIEVP
jgi:hypothetical protein